MLWDMFEAVEMSSGRKSGRYKDSAKQQTTRKNNDIQHTVHNSKSINITPGYEEKGLWLLTVSGIKQLHDTYHGDHAGTGIKDKHDAIMLG